MPNDLMMPVPTPQQDMGPVGAQSLTPTQPSAFTMATPTTAEGVLRQTDPILGADAVASSMATRNAIFNRQEQLNEAQLRAAQEHQRSMEPRYQELERAVAGRQLPAIPEQVTPPKPPTYEDAQKQTWEQGWVSAAMMLAVVGGALTRRPITNALAAFTGMANGIAEGNKEKYEANMKTWEAENKRAIEMNQQAQKRYENILKRDDMSIEQKKIMLEIEAMRWKDQGMMLTAQQKGLEELGHIQDGRDKLLTDFERRFAGRKAEAGRQEAEAWADSPAGKREIAEIINHNRPPPPPTPRVTDYRSQAVIDRLPADFDYGGYKVAQAERTRRLGFFSVADERQVQNQGTSINHLEQLGKLYQGLGNGEINALNATKQWAQQQLGIAAPTSFDAARNLIGGEIVKAVVANGGGVTDRQEIMHNLSRARSPEQAAQLIDTYQTLIAAQMVAKKRQYDFSREGVPNAPAFEKQLTPKHRELMEKAERSFTVSGDPEGKDKDDVRNAQKSDLQRNIDAIFGGAQKTGMGLATGITGSGLPGMWQIKPDVPKWAEQLRQLGLTVEPWQPGQ